MPFIGFEVDVTRAIRRYEDLIEAQVRQIAPALERGMGQIGRRALGLFQQATATWRHRPLFLMEAERFGSYVSVAVSTRDPIFAMVDKGTKPHTIRPRPGGVLAFRAGYQAKSSPGSLQSRSGGPFGEMVFTRKAIRHPGTKARDITGQVQRASDRLALPILEREIDRVLD